MLFFFFKQKTAYEMRISDWSSDVCSSDLLAFSPAEGYPGASPAAGGGRNMVNTPDSPVFPLRRRLKVMAGHSQFKNIMHRKGAQDAKKAKVFTKLIRELTTAARAGQIGRAHV